MVLLPRITIKEAVAMFANPESDALPVVDGPETRQIIGLLPEARGNTRWGGIPRSWRAGGGSLSGD